MRSVPTATLHELGYRRQLVIRGGAGHLAGVEEKSEKGGLTSPLTSDHERVPVHCSVDAAHDATTGTATTASMTVANVGWAIIWGAADSGDHKLASIVYPRSVHPAVHDGHASGEVGREERGGDGGEG